MKHVKIFLYLLVACVSVWLYIYIIMPHITLIVNVVIYTVAVVAMIAVYPLCRIIHLKYGVYIEQHKAEKVRIVYDTKTTILKHNFAEKMAFETIKQLGQCIIAPTHVGDMSFTKMGDSAINNNLLLNSPPAESHSVNYIELLTDSFNGGELPRYLVFGGMKSGKTSLLLHTCDHAIKHLHARGGDIFVIDPHAPLLRISNNVKIIGAGSDYESIADFLDRLVRESKRRLAHGCDEDVSTDHVFKPIYVLCDEWTGIIDNLINIKRWSHDYTSLFYQDSRKAKIGYLLSVHEFTVGAMGVKGKGRLVSGGINEFIKLHRTRSKRHFATIQQTLHAPKEEILPLITPGPYNGGNIFYTADEQNIERANKHKYLQLAPPKIINESNVINFSTQEQNDSTPTAEHDTKILAAYDMLVAQHPDKKPSIRAIITSAGLSVGGKQYDVVKTVILQNRSILLGDIKN